MARFPRLRSRLFAVFACLASLILLPLDAQPPPQGSLFDNIVVVPLANIGINATLGDPYLRNLSQSNCSRLFANWDAVSHPAQPNYLAMVAAGYSGVNTSANVLRDNRTIVDLLDEAGISWGVYAEYYPGSLNASQLVLPSQYGYPNIQSFGCGSDTDYNKRSVNCYSPGGCFFGAYGFMKGHRSRLYARSHFPFLSFTNFTRNYSRCSQAGDQTKFFADAANSVLPSYAFYVPNQCNAGYGGIKGCYKDKKHIKKKARRVSAYIKAFLLLLNETSMYLNSGKKILVLFVQDEATDKKPLAIAYGCNIVERANTSVFVNLTQTYNASKTNFKIQDWKNWKQYYPYTNVTTFNLSADTRPYNHYSINALIAKNWNLNLTTIGYFNNPVPVNLTN